MKKKLTAIMFLLALFSLSMSISASAAVLTIPDISAAVGPVEIPVNVDNADGIAGFQLTATYDPAVLNCTGAAAGSLTGGWVMMPNTRVSGQITVGGFSPTLTALPAGSGSVVLLLCSVLQDIPSMITLSSWSVTSTLGSVIGSCTSSCDSGGINQPSIVCGNGVVEGTEECDDGNTSDGDCCSATCQFESEGSGCDDGQFCTVNDSCDGAGTCLSGLARDCSDGVNCTVDSCDEENDQCVNTPNDALCDDGLWCNGSEYCDAATGCMAGTAPNCDDGIACTVDACNETTDSCDHTPNNAYCDDGLFCNGSEYCNVTMGCMAGTAPCPGRLCDEANDICVDCLNDAQCDDGLYCNGQETCTGGSCVPGIAVNCSDGIACTVDSCNEMTDSCDHTPNNALCNDGLWCNGSEYCDAALGCMAGTAPNCDDGVACTVDSCNETADRCDHVANNAFCSDGLFCNGQEYCDAALGCMAGTPPNCNDGIACTVDSCNETTDSCDHTPNNALCDDGLWCNGSEYCDAAMGCHAGTAPNCDDGIACTVDACNETTDSCDHTPNNAYCDDGLFCNGSEHCDAAAGCMPGTNPCPGECCESTDTCGPCPVCGNGIVDAGEQCDDGNVLNGDCCSSSCQFEPAGSSCADSLYCDGQETCNGAGVCQEGTPVNCDDGVACTVDSCNEATDSCDHQPNNAYCDDGAWCNGTEYCDAATGCRAGTAPNCDDGIACTDDSCNETTDSCDHRPNNSLCDDGVWCNGSEYCDAAMGCKSGDDPCPGQCCDEETDICIPCPSKVVSIPDDLSGCAGETVQVPVNVDDATGIAGFQCDVSYDPSILDCTDATSGDLTEGWMIASNAVTDMITVAGIDPTITGLSSVSGSLAIISCQVLGAVGVCTDIDLSCTLVDTMAATIPSSADSGKLCVEICEVIPAAINIDPDTLNVKSAGKFITAYIRLMSPYSAGQIVPSSVMLKDESALVAMALTSPVGMYDSSTLMVKFDRETVGNYLKAAGKTSAMVEFTVTGSLMSGETFEGKDMINVIDPGKKK